jgi:TonB family protein
MWRAFLILSLGVVSWAQFMPPTVSGGFGMGSVGRKVVPPSPAFGAGPVSEVVVTGAPYSAEGQSQNIQTLSDGTHITSPLLCWKFYRDSQGRTRVERPVVLGLQFEPPNTEKMTVIEVTDPVAEIKFTLDPVRKVVHKQRWSAPTSAPVTGVFSPGQGGQRQPTESLGEKTIEGLLCEGTRDTTIWPIGSMRNDRPISAISEVWKSAELQLVVLNEYRQPQTGERTQKLVNISRAEPPADLFQPPADYTLEADSTDDAYSIGGAVSAPQLISKAEPEYSEQARQARYSGSVLLSIVVDINGMPRDIKVTRPLGLGLDEKAIEAVMKWRFRPGLKNGVPVPVRAHVEVSFRM